MAKNLVIVESPAKAKTIEGYLGKDYVVKSSFGHVRDLAGKKLSVDIENNYEPVYEVSSDKKNVVKELKSLAKKAEMVWLATDEDREGEAISWHLKEALGLDESKTKRITFNEITKTAVTKAIDNPRNINIQLVDAQQARRVLDRLVGFELSPVLWKKVKPSLSAGRVQSVAVRLIVEREKEIIDFKPTSSYRVIAYLTLSSGETVKAELPKRFKTEKEANDFLAKTATADYSISNLEVKPAKKSPAAPFTTSTLQQEASRKLGFSVARTMSVAQRLYESGKITYMRTDSVNLSDTAVNGCKDEIIKSYGPEYANPKKYQTKSKSAQEAHEAIRPTDLGVRDGSSDRSEQGLYELIWKRTIASQMSNAELEKTTVSISLSNTDEILEAKGEVLKFDGFLKVYLEGNDDESEEQKGILPPMSVGDKLELDSISATERFTHHPPRYTEAALVKKLEELGIGRPSTYAPTISTIQKRGYVEKGEKEGHDRKYIELSVQGTEVVREEKTERTGAEKGKMYPTDIGVVVNDFLVEHFERIMDYSFTATVEKEFDDIANGLMQWTEMIHKFYQPFHHNVEDTLENSERAKGERQLGEDPATGKPIIARIGRFGPMVQIGQQDDEEKPRFASLLKSQSISTITLEEALELFKLPREVGEYNGEKVTAAIGRFGPYVRFGKMFVSLKKENGDDPLTVDIERAIELIEEKKKADANAKIAVFEEGDTVVQVLNGRYGPYIKIGKKNYKIPKGTEPESLGLEDCLKIAEEADAKKKETLVDELAIYFKPIDGSSYKSNGDQKTCMGDFTSFHDASGMPNADGAQIAIIGVKEYRGANQHKNASDALDEVRGFFYKLSNHATNLRLIDLGDIHPGDSIVDTYHALTKSVEFLVKSNIIPVVLGGSQDLSYPHYTAFEKLERTINLVSVDSKFDLGDVEGPLHSESYLGKIVLHQPNFLFNFSNIGYQSYFADSSVMELMDGLHFESYRLGEVRSDIQKVEPIVRNADMLSFDLSSIRMSDAPAAIGASPHGFYGEEACAIVRYAGMSDKLTTIGFYNLHDIMDRGQTPHLLAQLIWFFIDGYLGRKKDFPVGSKDDYTKYRVTITEGEHEILFLKSPQSGRWWMEVPYPPDERLRLARHAMVPCNYSDYEQAMQDEMPDLWIKTYLKLA